MLIDVPPSRCRLVGRILLDNPVIMRTEMVRLQPAIAFPIALLASCYTQLDNAWTLAQAEEDVATAAAEAAAAAAAAGVDEDGTCSSGSGGNDEKVVQISATKTASVVEEMERAAWSSAIVIMARFWATRSTCTNRASGRLLYPDRVVPLKPAAPFKLIDAKAGAAEKIAARAAAGAAEWYASGSSSGGGGGGGTVGAADDPAKQSTRFSPDDISRIVNSPKYKTPPGRLNRRLAIDEAGKMLFTTMSASVVGDDFKVCALDLASEEWLSTSEEERAALATVDGSSCRVFETRNHAAAGGSFSSTVAGAGVGSAGVGTGAGNVSPGVPHVDGSSSNAMLLTNHSTQPWLYSAQGVGTSTARLVNSGLGYVRPGLTAQYEARACSLSLRSYPTLLFL